MSKREKERERERDRDGKRQTEEVKTNIDENIFSFKKALRIKTCNASNGNMF
jgi:hypothetical protein